MAEYHELVFEGSLPIVRAFLTGLRLGKGWATPFMCSEDYQIHGDSLGHRVLETIRLTKDLTYVVVIDRHVPVISEAVRAAQKTLDLAVRRDRAVREAKFDYTFAVFDRKIASKLRGLLDQTGPDLVRTDAEEKEDVHPEGKGVEVYTPEHEYAFKGKGTVSGPLPQVLAYRDALKRFEQVMIEKVVLVLR
jgi:hypothetical protein